MDEPRADLHMLNIVTGDLAASLDFYRLLGVDVPEVGDDHAHVELPQPGGFSLEIDAAASAQIWHAGFRADPGSVGMVMCFRLPSSEAVSERYAELTAAGYPGRQPPFDAFWGARYAIVADPDGNDVGLMGPIDDARRHMPPTPSPDP